MDQAAGFNDAAKPAMDVAARGRERRLEQLIVQLPRGVQSPGRWLRRPSLRWVRIPGGILLIAASLFSILPLFGLWMLPPGLVLLAEDVPVLRRARDRSLDWIERRRPHWFARSAEGASPSPDHEES
jgi:hypothetical protein